MQVYFFPRLITVFYKASKSPVLTRDPMQVQASSISKKNAQLWARHDSNHWIKIHSFGRVKTFLK